MWYNGQPVSYANWNTSEPDNRVDTQDIGNVSPLGEHWVYMDAGGMWSDDGLHVSYGGDYKPRRRALVMWGQQLDCVNGLTQNDQTTTNDLVNLYCNGQTPCYLCVSKDGSSIGRCEWGSVFSGGNAWLCPYKTACNQSYTCPSGSQYDSTGNVCFVQASASCPSGGTYNAQRRRCEAQPIY